MTKEITIYTSKTCNHCREVKLALKEKSIKYIEIDKDECRDKWKQVVDLTSIPMFPTVEIEGEFLVPGRDFNEVPHLVNIITNFEKPKYNEKRRLIELIKTLNYNVYSAFNRLDVTLKNIENKLNK